MRGKVNILAKNRHISFNFTLERNVTIITGDSGTGKTKLINMIRDYSELGKSSGVTLKCDKPCIVLEGRAWVQVLDITHNSVVFVEESTSFLNSHYFAKAIQQSDNYYVLVTREALPQIPYSVDSVMRIIKNGSKPELEKIYNNISVDDIADFPYDMVIVEDSKSGFELFTIATDKWNVKCISSMGKSGILPLLKENSNKNILVVADGSALGSEIKALVRYKSDYHKKLDFFLPESFEWLILKSDIFANNLNIHNILKNPVDHIESKDFFSWERFFTYLLIEETKDILNAVANRAIDVEQILHITRRRRKAYCRMVTTTTQLYAKYADRYARFATAFSINHN